MTDLRSGELPGHLSTTTEAGVHASAREIRVAIKPPTEGSEWEAGSLVDWRWVDQGAAIWEGLVRQGPSTSRPRWIPGERLVRVGAEPPRWSTRSSLQRASA